MIWRLGGTILLTRSIDMTYWATAGTSLAVFGGAEKAEVYPSGQRQARMELAASRLGYYAAKTCKKYRKERIEMHTTLTSKGQVTIPKHIRDALHLEPGCAIEFRINREGEVVLTRPNELRDEDDRFERLRGKADVKWRTDDLMALLRGDN